MVRIARHALANIAIRFSIGLCIFVVSIPNAGAQTSRTVALTPQSIDTVFKNYYRAPMAEHVSSVIAAAMAQGLANDRQQRLNLIAFMAGLIATDEAFVERLAPVFQKLPEEQPMRLVRAVLYSGRADWSAQIDKLKLRWPAQVDAINAVAAKGARAVYQLKTDGQPEVLDMNWAFFAASGRIEPIQVAIAALADLRSNDPQRLANAHRARITLASHAREHDIVIDVCRRALWGSYGNDIRNIIKAAEDNDIARLTKESADAMAALAPRAGAQATPTAAAAQSQKKTGL